MRIHDTILWEGDQEEIWAKDWNFSHFVRKSPQMETLVLAMKNLLPERKALLVDLIVRDHKVGDYTCRDIRWHFDGDYSGNNSYALWAKGPNRTEFPEIIPELNPPQDRESQNRYLEGLSLVGIEVPEMSVVTYDSRIPHRGVVCRSTGKRIFVRLLTTDTINAKNLIRRRP